MTILLIALGCWLLWAVASTIALYYGYCFAMAGRGARDHADPAQRSQRLVAVVDTKLSFPVVVLDALYNVTVLTIVMCDFRWAHTFNLATGRLNLYTASADERYFRVWLANVYAAFLNGKDKDHIKNVTMRFGWLD
nr:MAG TPA: hypothetical protein [Caudoviricetes sp.]